MVFQKISDSQPVTRYLVQLLTAYLQGGRVLWLVPGGSSIVIAADVSRQLKPEDTNHLTISLTDERYGDVGHPDSNWQQLMNTGFQVGNAQVLPVLTGSDMGTTTTAYGKALQEAMSSADYRVGFFGMGADGHTAGILPNSPAVHDENFAASYDAGNFKRITMTPKAITYLDETVIYAVGEEKREALLNLNLENLPLETQPAQIHKQIQKCTIFNDQIGEEA